MEVIELAGYTEMEKLHIAKQYLSPKAWRARADPTNSRFADDAFQTIIERYTREAGVRNLEREIVDLPQGRAQGRRRRASRTAKTSPPEGH